MLILNLQKFEQYVDVEIANSHTHNILYLLNTDLNLVVSTNNLPCHKYLDLHWNLIVAVRYHSNLFVTLNVELFDDPRVST